MYFFSFSIKGKKQAKVQYQCSNARCLCAFVYRIQKWQIRLKMHKTPRSTKIIEDAESQVLLDKDDMQTQQQMVEGLNVESR